MSRLDKATRWLDRAHVPEALAAILAVWATGFGAHVATLTPVGANAGTRQAYISGQWTTGFQVGFNVAPGNSQGYVFNYTVVEP